MQYFLSIFFGTFVLEDLALASALVLVSENKISFGLAFLACFSGICLGDIGLYFIGYLAAKFGIEKHLSFFKKFHSTLAQLRHSAKMNFAIVISRAIPGTRLPTYLVAGFIRFSFLRFFWLTFASVFVWVAFAMSAGKFLQYFFKDNWIWLFLSFVLVLNFVKNILPKFLDSWDRKSLLHSWRRWLHFEFWPAWFFYIPILPMYIYLSIKHRSPFMPFYASPDLAHGGLVGESKWDFIRHLNPSDLSTLNAIKVESHLDLAAVKSRLEQSGFQYPFVIKPDVGQRGFGVRIIRNEEQLAEYIRHSDFDRIFQRLSTYTHEAGVFYVRPPELQSGFIFSLTDKVFPFVMGDGISKLGDLILKDPRARIISSVYFARLRARLDSVPQRGEIVYISECGNHCQGAIFKNGKDMITEELKNEFDRLAKAIPNFYFGRFDIKYQSPELLKLGKAFEIVEINGAGSEATHIWDAGTQLLDAYRVLFKQWSLLFQIGAFQYSKNPVLYRMNFLGFLKEVVRINRRQSDLSVSS